MKQYPRWSDLNALAGVWCACYTSLKYFFERKVVIQQMNDAAKIICQGAKGKCSNRKPKSSNPNPIAIIGKPANKDITFPINSGGLIRCI